MTTSEPNWFSRLFGLKKTSQPTLPSTVSLTGIGPHAGDASRKSKYWQCQGCGTIYTKDDAMQSIFGVVNETFQLFGGSNCATCGTRHLQSDILAGKYDMLAPDSLIVQAIADSKNAVWDAAARVWKYKGQELRGSVLFEDGSHVPSNVEYYLNKGQILTWTLTVDRKHLLNADASEIEEVLASMRKQIRAGHPLVQCQLVFYGYNNDPRAICEIPEIRIWCAMAWAQSPEIVPFLEQQVTKVSQMFLWCLLDVGVTAIGDNQGQYAVPTEAYTELVSQAAVAAARFLQSCGYPDFVSYVNKWIASVYVSGDRIRIDVSGGQLSIITSSF
jgi:hypothetical protein